MVTFISGVGMLGRLKEREEKRKLRTKKKRKKNPLKRYYPRPDEEL